MNPDQVIRAMKAGNFKFGQYSPKNSSLTEVVHVPEYVGARKTLCIIRTTLV